MIEKREWYYGECESCGYEGAVKDFTHRHLLPKEQTSALCYVCQYTKAGNTVFHPQVYENVGVLRTVARCTNMILDALEEGRPPSVPVLLRPDDYDA